MFPSPLHTSWLKSLFLVPHYLWGHAKLPWPHLGDTLCSAHSTPSTVSSSIKTLHSSHASAACLLGYTASSMLLSFTDASPAQGIPLCPGSAAALKSKPMLLESESEEKHEACPTLLGVLTNTPLSSTLAWRWGQFKTILLNVGMRKSPLAPSCLVGRIHLLVSYLHSS